MTRVIDSSFENAALTTALTWKGELTFRFQVGWKAHKYAESDISEVHEIDEEAFRSAGRAAAGAIIGGVLTGGIGLLAGAAIGGRRRRNATYVVRFNDGNFVAFEEKAKKIQAALSKITEREKISEITKDLKRVE